MSGTTEGGSFFVLTNPHRSRAAFEPLSLADSPFSPDPLALAIAQDREDLHDSVVEAAHWGLFRAMKALPSRSLVPCIGGTLPTDWWTSDDRDERDAAAERCGECPVIVACGVAGAAGKGEAAGVWGGVDRVPRPRKPGRKPR